ncbi:hypothetical protein ILUMI_07700 [Ignelater luminosus]|uniref:Uncharacterized protein n=1 Tax=Ignelater luminosus TaxID=2038154 RepID=A0A8K0D7S4_IGNLU|nr:hypothetical protein ILUMI_07700 [Ignelater luminosus]
MFGKRCQTCQPEAIQNGSWTLFVYDWQKKRIKRGRPSAAIEEQLEIKRKKCPSVKIPPKDVRKDLVEHWPEWKGYKRTMQISFMF